MLDRRAKNAEIFKNTVRMYQTNEKLKEVLEKSIAEQKLIGILAILLSSFPFLLNLMMRKILSGMMPRNW